MRMLLCAVLIAGGGFAASPSAASSPFSPQVQYITINSGEDKREVRARKVQGSEHLAEARRILGSRCTRMDDLVQLQGDPVGPDAIVYRVSCDTGLYQLSVVGTRSYVKPWTGSLRD